MTDVLGYSAWIEIGTCSACARANVEVLTADTSGGEYSTVHLCHRCISLGFKRFRAEQRRAASPGSTAP